MDTSPAAQAVQDELIRRKTGEERLRMAQEMTLAMQHLAFAGLRARYPDLPDDEIWLKLAAARLGRDTVRKVYGRDINPS
jgi:predicted alpha-1,6-mannanase (GH76 family)